MNAWTNDSTGHNRTIDTGPTPDGKLDHLYIQVSYVGEDGLVQGGDWYKITPAGTELAEKLSTERASA